MGSHQIFAMPTGALYRARFFEAHGVALESPARSTSGVRAHDGMVVFAMSAARVRIDPWGCSCLLWTGKDHLIEHASSMERLHHCRLAVEHGIAEGFLLGRNNGPPDRDDLLALRVVSIRREYWARWGGMTRAELAGVRADAGRARSQ